MGSFASVLERMLRSCRSRHAAGLLALCSYLLTAVPSAAKPVAIPPGVWLFDEKAAIQIYACRDLLCGRILWLKILETPQATRCLTGRILTRRCEPVRFAV